MFGKRTAFEVIGGKNLLKKSMGNIYTMKDMTKVHGEGVVDIKGVLYYYLGVVTNVAHKRSAGGAAVGAIAGGILTGGVGAVVGAAVGGRRKDDSTFEIELADYDTKETFSLQVRLMSKKNPITDFRVAQL